MPIPKNLPTDPFAIPFRGLELESVAKELPSGKHKIAVKVVDIFGNDTMYILEVIV